MGTKKNIDLSLKTDLVIDTAVLTCQQQVFLQIDFTEKLANFIHLDTMEYDKYAHHLEFKEGILLSVKEFSKFKELKKKLTKENRKLTDLVNALTQENKELTQANSLLQENAIEVDEKLYESDAKKVVANYHTTCEEIGL